VPPLPAEKLTLLVYLVLALVVVLALLVLGLAVRLRQLRRTYTRLLGGGSSEEDILAAVARHVDAVERLQGKLSLIGRETANLRQRISSLVRTVGFTRYDAFPDTGGQLSWSAAFLDEAGDGIVLSAIHGRNESRTYAKPVKAGRSAHNLSEEEMSAIATAMGQARPIARSSA
jgi:Protein of unknown function (DUF4446)